MPFQGGPIKTRCSLLFQQSQPEHTQWWHSLGEVSPVPPRETLKQKASLLMTLLMGTPSLETPSDGTWELDPEFPDKCVIPQNERRLRGRMHLFPWENYTGVTRKSNTSSHWKWKVWKVRFSSRLLGMMLWTVLTKGLCTVHLKGKEWDLNPL